jgi:hypothetical protein
MTGAFAGLFYEAFSFGRGFGVNGLAFVLAAYVADRIASVIVVDNLWFRFSAVAAGSVVNTAVRLLFFRLLKLELPVLAGGRNLAATLVFDLIANLIGSVLLYIALDRVFIKDAGQRVRRMEARRLRIRR